MATSGEIDLGATFSNSGGSGVSSINSLTGAVTLAAGSNITITPSGNTLTIASSGSSSPLTTKGDLFTFTTVNARLAVGSDAQVLAADSTQATGLKWVAAAAGTVTSVALTVPAFLSVAGSPITSSGTLAVSLSGTALPIANGGTNSIAALNNNRVMQSSGGAIVEAAAITASRALASDANGIPVAATTTTTELNFVSGVTSAIQTQLNAKQSTALTSAHLLVGNGSNVATDVAVSGDLTLANTGAFTIANSAVTNAKIANSTIDLTAKVTGALPLVNGGTGTAAGSANAAFNALSPLTTKGDILSYSTVNARLGVGTDGQVLSADSTQTTGLKWIASGGGSGTVTSVAMSVPAFLSVAGSPITTSGTLAVTLSGTALPIANGGTGSTTQNFVDLTTTQSSIAGAKTFTSSTSIAGAAASVATIGAASSTAVHQINGGLKVTTRSISGNLTIDTTTTDYIIFVDTSGGAVSVTFPAPTNGRILIIKDSTGSFGTNNCTMVRNGSEKIEGTAASKILSTNWGSSTFTSNGTDWFMI